MILVDTTVWIDFFANRDTSHVRKLITILNQNVELCLCGVILTEILQGIKNIKEYNRVHNLMESLFFLEMKKETFLFSAEIYKKLRSKGITIRKTLDCMIAAVAMEHNVPLLHNDRDFDPIEKHFSLKIIPSTFEN